jgi:hypothetical protein
MRFMQTGIQRILARMVCITATIAITSCTTNQPTSDGSNRPVSINDQVITTTIPPITVVITTPTTTIPNVDNVDWVALTELYASEQEAMRTDYIDEQRMLHGQCGEWHDLAISVGWTESEWSTLSRIIYRESRCQPDACSKSTSGLRCRDAGLVQANQVHTNWLNQNGWSFPDSMFDPELNLRFAKMLHDSSGWSPWAWLGMD